MISTGLATSRRARAAVLISDSTTRPKPTASSENSHARTKCSGITSLAKMPIIATVIAAIETALTTGTTPSSTNARRRVR